MDVGAGSGHVGADLHRSGRKRGLDLRFVATDRKLSHLVTGRRWGHVRRAVVAAAEELPFADGAVDGSLSNLLFHHFDPATNRRVVDEMRRISRRSVAVVDLRRCRFLDLAAPLFLRLLRLGDVAYEDGVASVARSYRLDEVAAIVGVRARDLRRCFPGRWSLVIDASGDPGPKAAGRDRPPT